MCKEVLSSFARKMVFSVQSLSSLCLCGYFLRRQVKPRRHRELKGCTEKNWLSVVVLLLFASVVMFAQSPSPTPVDKRGLGIQSPSSTTSTTTDQRAREAKPELVLQTGYNNFYGATRLVFSPDGKLLATATVRSNTVSLWETATNRKLRLDVETLRAPQRLERIAIDQLHMLTPSPKNTLVIERASPSAPDQAAVAAAR